MSRTTVRRMLTAAIALPVTLAATIAVAPVAVASPEITLLAAFSGGYTTDCDLPVEPGTGGQIDGPYECSHFAEALPVAGSTKGCGNAVIWGPLEVRNKTCEARLRSGWTTGHADAIGSGLGYRCTNGAGAGTFEYAPEAGGPTYSFFVWLEVQGGVININGSYLTASGQFIVVRATMPAQCAQFAASPEGFNGTVTPV